MKKLIIGLTGGIASGKSTVSDIFKKLGATIIDADQITRELCQPKSNNVKKIVKKFGETVLNPDHSLNRIMLRGIIFQNPSHRIWLENLLHPEVQKIMDERAKNTETPYTILVVPLLLETNYPPKVDRILVVDSDEENQIKRLKKRQLTKSEIESILKTQTTRQHRLSKANDIITNNGDLTQLEKQVQQLHRKYRGVKH